MEEVGGGLFISNLSLEDPLSNFDCGDSDLNEFFLKDSHHYERLGLAVTKILHTSKGEILAFWSLANDAISTKTTDLSNRQFGSFRERFPEPKQVLRSIPAIKLARLAVSINSQRKGFGQFIIKKIELESLKSFSAVAFITVDAYQNEKAIAFYQKHGFNYLTENDAGKPIRSMYKHIPRN